MALILHNSDENQQTAQENDKNQTMTREAPKYQTENGRMGSLGVVCPSTLNKSATLRSSDLLNHNHSSTFIIEHQNTSNLQRTLCWRLSPTNIFMKNTKLHSKNKSKHLTRTTPNHFQASSIAFVPGLGAT